MSQSEIAGELAARGLGAKNQITNILKGLSQLAVEELEAGNDFAVPGIAVVRWRYIGSLAKGERYKKGETVVGIGGTERVADADSPARKASIKLKVSTSSAVNRLKPKKDTLATFMKSKTAKAVVARSKK
jgi:hypothetical protein